MSRQICTCVGSCRGPEKLGDGWVCVLETEPYAERIALFTDNHKIMRMIRKRLLHAEKSARQNVKAMKQLNAGLKRLASILDELP